MGGGVLLVVLVAAAAAAAAAARFRALRWRAAVCSGVAPYPAAAEVSSANQRVRGERINPVVASRMKALA
jgi:hypothetical protein